MYKQDPEDGSGGKMSDSSKMHNLVAFFSGRIVSRYFVLTRAQHLDLFP